ncbi:putative serine/threonine protein phosphatase [Erwinia phage vB_EamM_RisingSun]|uniref:Putative serine/threonine protein phosphatase n=2 Tax=Risingsunvirus risingsun TaxID=2560435 RepID=A0A223LI27_9CAUD|nr:phosphoesterase [Erwinia phage vB_EamM_RisingSun]ASU03523.1 putative serine/threonine protein phosphatase [Erwinia phage vB_EamM_RisingSun]ASU03767.1 putative serine/threonine protein phosphatase [Erwinia phage vB_EamM_Joad]
MPHFLGADFHLCDPSSLKYRKQFPSLGYHDEYVCDVVLAKLRPNDLLTMVGDCLVGKGAIELIKKFPCRKRLIAGNHEFEKGINFADLVGVVDEIHSSYKWRGRFNIVHIPPHPAHLRGKTIIHGHLHEVIIPDPRFINVSLEATGYRLVQAEEIITGEYRSYRIPEVCT